MMNIYLTPGDFLMLMGLFLCINLYAFKPNDWRWYVIPITYLMVIAGYILNILMT
jgi:hypothetical protein